MCRLLLILFVLLLAAFDGRSQENRPGTLGELPNRFIGQLNRKSAVLEDKLEKQTVKYLQRLARKEQKLKRRLQRTDSIAAQALFDDTEATYAHLAKSYSRNDDPADALTSPHASDFERRGRYAPYLDSITTSLKFLEQHPDWLGDAAKWKDQLQGSLGKLQGIQSKLQQADQVKAFIKQRKQQIKEVLSRNIRLPKSITRSYNDLNKDIFYYTQQVSEYRELLNNPDRLTERLLAELNRFDVFKRFMQEHSELAGLFGMPANYGTPQALAGLQSRAQVQQLIQTQLSAAGPNLPAGQAGAQQILQQNIQQAQAQLSQLKDKINKLGGSEGADLDLPDKFKPNTQKTKSFWKRLEYGTNLQTAKSNYFWPTTTDLGLSVGYKLSDKSTIGIGASYKVGWGKDIRHIEVTNEGVGFRSYAETKLKGSFYASGGFEYNYQPLALSAPGVGLQEAAWQQSGLVGLSKIVSIKSKFFKKTKLQLLWDFLSYQQVPQTQAVKFRIGYSF